MFRYLTKEGKGNRSNCQYSLDHRKSKGILFHYTKAFDYVDHNKLQKIIKQMEIPDHLTCPLRRLYAGQEATVRKDVKQQTGSKLGKEYVKAVYCHSAYLTYMHSTSCEMPSCRNHKLESRLLRAIPITADKQMIYHFNGIK